jgi:hypothetical protein
MSDNRREMLDDLKLELRFLETGGYEPSVHEPRKELNVFRDSPSCLNYALPVKEHSCSECWLIDFVPASQRSQSMPCHHIPLNERGDTIASIGKPGNDSKVQETMRDWLRKKIEEFEEWASTSRFHWLQLNLMKLNPKLRLTGKF